MGLFSHFEVFEFVTLEVLRATLRTLLSDASEWVCFYIRHLEDGAPRFGEVGLFLRFREARRNPLCSQKMRVFRGFKNESAASAEVFWLRFVARWLGAAFVGLSWMPKWVCFYTFAFAE